MALFSDLLVSALILVGAFFLFVGSFGLAKLPDIMRRLHAPTKATTLGIGSMLVASMLYFLIGHRDGSFHELMITVFLFLTAPVTAHMVAKAHILRDHSLHRSLPPPPCGAWATLGKEAARGADPSSH